MEAITGAEVAGNSGPDFCDLARTLVNDLRSPLSCCPDGRGIAHPVGPVTLA
jgi:hypothetical protein